MNKLKILGLMILATLGVGCGAPSTAPATAILPYKIVKDEGEDTPIHSLVKEHILVSPPVDKQSLTDTLKAIFEMKKAGPFTYHPEDPDIALYVYDDVGKLNAGQGAWVAMLMSRKGGNPKIDFKDTIIGLSGTPQTTRFGLSEAARKGLVKEVADCEDKGRNAEYCEPLVGKKYGISRANVKAINLEAAEKGWPF